MKPVGIDLGKLLGGAKHSDGTDAPFIQPTCPGARVYVSRHDLALAIQGGEVFEREGTNVPAQGYGHARVRCGRLIPGRKGIAGHVVYDGLCSSCHQLEENNRAELRERQNPGRKAAE